MRPAGLLIPAQRRTWSSRDGSSSTDDADLAARLDNAAEEIDTAIRDIRGTIFDLGARPNSGDDVVGALGRLIDRAAGILKFRPRLMVEGPVRTGIPASLLPDLLAVTGEALSNAGRHSDATQVDVSLLAGSTIELRVADNGRGIGSEVTPSGLANLRERAEAHGGECQTCDIEPHGTVVEWRVPLPGPGS